VKQNKTPLVMGTRGRSCRGRIQMLEGIQFVTNAEGEQTAVLIDLKRYGELWEDFYDALIARQRADEPRESLESVREALKQQGKLNA